MKPTIAFFLSILLFLSVVTIAEDKDAAFIALKREDFGGKQQNDDAKVSKDLVLDRQPTSYAVHVTHLYSDIDVISFQQHLENRAWGKRQLEAAIEDMDAFSVANDPGSRFLVFAKVDDLGYSKCQVFVGGDVSEQAYLAQVRISILFHDTKIQEGVRRQVYGYAVGLGDNRDKLFAAAYRHSIDQALKEVQIALPLQDYIHETCGNRRYVMVRLGRKQGVRPGARLKVFYQGEVMGYARVSYSEWIGENVCWGVCLGDLSPKIRVGHEVQVLQQQELTTEEEERKKSLVSRLLRRDKNFVKIRYSPIDLVAAKVTRIELSPKRANVAPGDFCELRATVYSGDEKMSAPLQWQVSDPTHRIVEGFFQAGNKIGPCRVTVSVPKSDITETAIVLVTWKRAARVEIQLPPPHTQKQIELYPGQTVQLSARFFDENGRSIPPKQCKYRWEAKGGYITANGVFRASTSPGTFLIKAIDESTGNEDRVSVVIPNIMGHSNPPQRRQDDLVDHDSHDTSNFNSGNSHDSNTHTDTTNTHKHTPQPDRNTDNLPENKQDSGLWSDDYPQLGGFSFHKKNAQGFFEYRHERTGMIVVLIPEGTFTMGSPAYEEGRNRREWPEHKVHLGPYLIGKYEVTQAQWEKIMGRRKNNSNNQSSKDLPVENVSWNDAQNFCKAAGLMLPTEAQWEKAARGRKNKRFFWGDGEGEADDYAWHGGNARSSTHPVGQKRANDYGLYDVSGNVGEWCRDGFIDGKNRESQNNPFVKPTKKYRVVRGGGFTDRLRECRSAFRQRQKYAKTMRDVGFRVCWPLK